VAGSFTDEGVGADSMFDGVWAAGEGVFIGWEPDATGLRCLTGAWEGPL
jgi:hypothetical protein